MKIFVSEFLTSGACPDELFVGSLLNEGRAMLLSLLSDIVSIPGIAAATTWDTRLGEFPLAGVSVDVVQGPNAARTRFFRQVDQCDATLLIAPESDGILPDQLRNVQIPGGQHLGSSAAAIRNCGDKLTCSDLLGSDSLPSRILNDEFRREDVRYPCVVKPRFGAGSCDTHIANDDDELRRLFRRFRRTSPDTEFLVQPYVPGPACSVAVLRDTTGHVETWPIVEQRISTHDGRLRYDGGCVPYDIDPKTADRIHDSARRAAIRLDVRGYTGVDFISPPDGKHPLIVDVNPRLTTSYLGYRRLTTDNPAARIVASCLAEDRKPQELIDATQAPVAWSHDLRVEFDTDGTVRHRAVRDGVVERNVKP